MFHVAQKNKNPNPQDIRFMTPAIHVFFEQVDPFRMNASRIKRWITSVALQQHTTVRSLNIILCSDDYLYQMNQDYLKHNTLTDIITFAYQEENEPIEGELYISIERVKENAASMDLPWMEELDRVMVHGVLHLMGYDDTTPEEKQAMRSLEDYCLTLRA